jgi:hypothetical protein
LLSEYLYVYFNIDTENDQDDEPQIGVAFGPDKAWMVWLDAYPRENEAPLYRG